MAQAVVFDTNILVYVVQPRSPFFQPSLQLLEEFAKSDNQLMISVFALAELWAMNLQGRPEEKSLMDALFKDYVFTELSFGRDEARVFANLRQRYPKLSAVDAVHLACALSAKADLFITNDQTIKKAGVKEIKVRLLSQ